MHVNSCEAVATQLTVASRKASDATLSGVKIGVFTSVTGRGGSEVLVFNAIQAAVEAGAGVVCWCERGAHVRELAERHQLSEEIQFLDWPEETYVEQNELNVTNRGRIGRRFWRMTAPESIRRIFGFDAMQKGCRAVRRQGVDVLFVNVNGSEAATCGGRLEGVPVIGCYHLSVARTQTGVFARLVDWLVQTRSMHACNGVIHTSRRVREQWNRRCFFPHAKTTVIYNGVPACADEAADLASLGIEKGTFVFCCPARLH